MNLNQMRAWMQRSLNTPTVSVQYHVSGGNVVHREGCRYYASENLMTAKEILDTIKDVRLCRVCNPRI